MNKSDGKKTLEAINLETGEYSPSKKINLGLGDKIDIKKLIERDDKYGKYAKSILTKVIRYAAFLIPDVSSKYIDIDDALRCYSSEEYQSAKKEIKGVLDRHIQIVEGT